MTARSTKKAPDLLEDRAAIMSEGEQKGVVSPEKDNWQPIGDLVREVVRKASKHG